MAGREPALGVILDAVQGALRRGDYAALPDLTTALETAAEGFVPAGATDAAALRRRLERNAACLLATARGLRAARRRLAEVAAAQGGLATYAASGQVTRIGGPDGQVAHRF